VITGASDGIGKEYAHALASNGCNVYLMSRTESKLSRLAEEIQSSYSVSTKILPVDFTLATDETFQHIQMQLNELDSIGILVNNVGINYNAPQSFAEASHSLDDALIKVNISTTTRMTKLILNHMLER
jgi:17beta-estradiol 17-dehydrogenase / very-long-chain 3-oxoacyl-CoA reductase